MLCSKCNASFEEGAKFCPNCGLEVGSVDGEKTGAFFTNFGEKVDEVVNKENFDAGKEKAKAFFKENVTKEKFNAAQEKAKTFIKENANEEGLYAGKEKANAFISKLPFRSLAEKKIPEGVQTKIPLIGKAIPFANHIACVLALVLFVLVIANTAGTNRPAASSPAAATVSSDINSSNPTAFQQETQTITRVEQSGNQFSVIGSNGNRIASISIPSSRLVGWNRSFFVLESTSGGRFSTRDPRGNEISSSSLPGNTGVGVGTDFLVVRSGTTFTSYDSRFRRISSTNVGGATGGSVSGDIITVNM